MNPHLLRAEVLLAQNRYDLAEREVGQALAESPDDAYTHALLAVCRNGQRQYKEAETTARRAVALDPEMAYSHYVLALALGAQRRWADGEAAIRSAIDLNPSDPGFYHVLSELRFNQEDWAGAAATAELGLALDARHAGCLNARAMALTKLGRRDEAARTVEGVLADNPEDPYSHLTRGWTALHQSDPDKALEHFKEALRLNPDLEAAREGMVLALKARYRVYRVLLLFFLWLHTRGRRFQWAVVIGILVSQQVAVRVARESPELAPVAWPVFYAILGFGLLTWLADPLFNLSLRFNRFGRHALSADARASSVWAGGWLLAGAVVLGYSLAADSLVARFGAFGCVLMAVASTAVYRFPLRWPRRAAAGFAVALLGAHTGSLWHFHYGMEAADRADASARLVRREPVVPTKKAVPGMPVREPVMELKLDPVPVAQMHDHLDAARDYIHFFGYGLLGLTLVSQYVASRR